MIFISINQNKQIQPKKKVKKKKKVKSDLYRLPMPNLSPIRKSSETLSKQIIQKDQTHPPKKKPLNLQITTPKIKYQRLRSIRNSDRNDAPRERRSRRRKRILAGLWTEVDLPEESIIFYFYLYIFIFI